METNQLLSNKYPRWIRSKQPREAEKSHFVDETWNDIVKSPNQTLDNLQVSYAMKHRCFGSSHCFIPKCVLQWSSISTIPGLSMNFRGILGLGVKLKSKTYSGSRHEDTTKAEDTSLTKWLESVDPRIKYRHPWVAFFKKSRNYSSIYQTLTEKKFD